MNIDRIQVLGLFDELDHDLKFSGDERIMILTGLNGSGKTTILNLINVLFNKPLFQLCSIPFYVVKIFFNNDSNLIIKKDIDHSTDDDHTNLPLSFNFHEDGETHFFDLTKNLIDEMVHEDHLSSIDEIIPELRRIDRFQWINSDGYYLSLADVVSDYSDFFMEHPLSKVFQTPRWLQEIKSSVNVHFINTERLTRVDHRQRRYSRTTEITRTVSHYSKHLADNIKEKITKYGTISQSLDRTFPVRLVNNRPNSSLSVSSLRSELKAIEKKRSDLENAGLLASEKSHLEIPNFYHIDDPQIDVLSVYTQDAKKKLAVFDDLYTKVSVFKRIVNSRFTNKIVTVSPDGLQVCKNGKDVLNLELLSSGEQHELVMLYDLLFRATKNSLILIDEPEISLHAAWQEQWLDDLDEIANLSDFRAIVATHSPEIIGRRWNLCVELHTNN